MSLKPIAVPTTPSLPDLLDLEAVELPDGGELRELELEEHRGEGSDLEQVRALRVKLCDSRLEGLGLTGRLESLVVRDCVLERCDLSNVDAAADAEVRRIVSSGSKWIGLAFTGGELCDARFEGDSFRLASFAHARLKRVVFKGVDLREAAFVGCELDSVVFEGCALAGANFQGAQIRDCAIRGSSLKGVLGVGSLRGARMPWSEVVASTRELAAGLGIAIEDPDDN